MAPAAAGANRFAPQRVVTSPLLGRCAAAAGFLLPPVLVLSLELGGDLREAAARR